MLSSLMIGHSNVTLAQNKACTMALLVEVGITQMPEMDIFESMEARQHSSRLAILQPLAGSPRCRKSPQPRSCVPHSAVLLRWPSPAAHTRSTGTLLMPTSLALTSVSYLACQYLSLPELLTKRLWVKLCNFQDCCHAIPILCPIQGSSLSSACPLPSTS